MGRHVRQHARTALWPVASFLVLVSRSSAPPSSLRCSHAIPTPDCSPAPRNVWLGRSGKGCAWGTLRFLSTEAGTEASTARASAGRRSPLFSTLTWASFPKFATSF